jgi:anti-sigma factor ChrR (cupin superfamily)
MLLLQTRWKINMSAIVWSDGKNSPSQEVFEGIYVRQLWQGEAGAQAILVDIAPGAKWQGIDFHHDNSEEVLVISGVFNDGTRDYPAGTFIHHPIGSSHIPQSATGCQLFIFYPQHQS